MLRRLIRDAIACTGPAPTAVVPDEADPPAKELPPVTAPIPSWCGGMPAVVPARRRWCISAACAGSFTIAIVADRPRWCSGTVSRLAVADTEAPEGVGEGFEGGGTRLTSGVVDCCWYCSPTGPDGAGLVEGAEDEPVVAYKSRAESTEVLGRWCGGGYELPVEADTVPLAAAVEYRLSVG